MHKGTIGSYHKSHYPAAVSLTGGFISPSQMVPNDGVTAGANNVYWRNVDVAFGQNSKASGKYVRIHFMLPDADYYVDGTNLTFKALIASGNAPSHSIPYQLNYYYARHLVTGGAFIETDTGTLTQGSGGFYQVLTETITGTSVKNLDALWADLYLGPNSPSSNKEYVYSAMLGLK